MRNGHCSPVQCPQCPATARWATTALALFSLDWGEWALSTCPPVQQKQLSVCAPGEKAAALSLPQLLMLHSRQDVHLTIRHWAVSATAVCVRLVRETLGKLLHSYSTEKQIPFHFLSCKYAAWLISVIQRGEVSWVVVSVML